MSLVIRDLQVAYGAHVALRAFSLVLAPGEIVAVIGPNGAGKSTLIKAISGVLPPAAGEIRLGGRPAGKDRARLAAVVPQGGYLPPAFTVRQAVLLGRTPYLGWLGRPQPVDLAAVEIALEETGLAGFADRAIGELSGGEAQRVLLARALAQETPVLLLDEPTSHLDLKHQAGILGLVRRLATSKPLAVLMVVHDLNLAALFADRVVLLLDGETAAAGAPQDVLTEEILSSVYGVRVRLAAHPGGGRPVVLLDPPADQK